MDHDLTTAPGTVADGLQPGGPAPEGAGTGAQAPPRPRDARGAIPGQGSGGGGRDAGDGDAGGGGGGEGDDGAGGRDAVGGETDPSDAPSASGPISTVRLASPGSVVASIPFLFGFHPENSLVVLGVSHSAEGGSFIRHGVRIDLEQVRGQERTTALELAARLRDQDADIAILVAFGPRTATGAKARPDHCRKLMAAFRAQLEAAASEERVTVVDALYTANGRWWSYMCRNNRCCPAAGTVVPAEAPAALAGAFTSRGHTVYASREALDATLDPHPPEILARTAAAAEHLDPTWYDTDAGLSEARRLMDTLLARCGDDPTDPAPRTPRPEGPRAGRRGLSDAATAGLPSATGAGSAASATSGAATARSSQSRLNGRSALPNADTSHAADDSAADYLESPGAAASHAAERSAADYPESRGADGSLAADRSADSRLASPNADASRAPTDRNSLADDFSPHSSDADASQSADHPATDQPGSSPHTSSAVIPAARTARRVTNRIPALGATSEGIPLGALAEPPGSLLAPPVMSDAEAAELLVALLNWRVRDYLACAASTVDSAGRLLRLGAELARRAPHPDLRLAPYALAAWAAWAIGRPAIAQCAVDRALAIDADYKFASLIRAGLHHAIDGEGVRESAASTRRDLFGEAVIDLDAADRGDADRAHTDPDTAPASIPSPRSTKKVPTESDLEIP
ncbi:hypothetical protein Caci_7400 [Catenulispora acidiphila DSM 44928]|uniref:DUF4192 domain-containing protein n=1 Tax=Catenulispora acidiphila (strain DSM 44928 / JCM 14897 / NBRC 102108 / NRRL B-24433 / ID139908) TaxID=479433 RepID=C7Q9Q7_CATAD|nr:DUF4192 domain-containing protein [Catenulispora acidiphila]ACU76226.1 hypothetical protein Caci_7400 [Catenulispora acidiphila DSM 44928]